MSGVNFRLLLVTDRTQTGGRSLPALIRQAISAGLPAIQLRERDLSTGELLALACEIQSITVQRAVPFILNDRVDLALAIRADGVHLRANSMPVAVARRLVGPDCLIGVSTHSIREVEQANRDGADYVLFGPIFDTPSKRPFGPPLGVAVLTEVCRCSAIPVFAVGGVTSVSVSDIRRAGAHGVAVIGAILTRDDAAAATRDLLRSLTM
jgi:thiamine-phosphate pyrophosphorylase